MPLSGAFVAPLDAPPPIALEEGHHWRTLSPEDTIRAILAAFEALDPASLPSGSLEQARGILAIVAASDEFDERCEAYHGRQARRRFLLALWSSSLETPRFSLRSMTRPMTRPLPSTPPRAPRSSVLRA